MSVFLTEVFKQSHTESWEKPTDDKVSKLQTVLLSMQEESQATKLLKKERESYKVNTELVAKRTDVQLRLEACRTATKEYEQGQEQLKRIVTENEQFIRNTDIKIEKADRKIREEQDQIQKKEEEIDQLKQQLTDLEDGRLDSEKRIKQKQPRMRSRNQESEDLLGRCRRTRGGRMGFLRRKRPRSKAPTYDGKRIPR